MAQKNNGSVVPNTPSASQALSGLVAIAIVLGLGVGAAVGFDFGSKSTLRVRDATAPSETEMLQPPGPEGISFPVRPELITMINGTLTEVNADGVTVLATIRYADPEKKSEERALRIGVTQETRLLREIALTSAEIEKNEQEVVAMKQKLADSQPDTPEGATAEPIDVPTELRASVGTSLIELSAMKPGEQVSVMLVTDIDSGKDLFASEIKVLALRGAPAAPIEARAQTEFPLVKPPEE